MITRSAGHSIQGGRPVGYKFSLTLSREIAEGEAEKLRESGCASAAFTTDSHPTKADVTVTKMDFDDAASASLAEAIEAALEAVKVFPDLTVPGLTVPAQPANAANPEEPDEEAAEPEPEVAVHEEPTSDEDKESVTR
jgi:hypothetical protein